MIRKHISTLLFLVTAVFPTAFASPDKKMTLLRTSKIFDSVSGAYLLDRDILISGNRIVDVRKKISAPEGTSILDLRKYTLLPGLIDTHTHLMLLDESFGQADSSEMLRNVKKGTALRVQEARPRAKDYLANGITTVRELGNSGEFGDVILKSEIDSGKIIGPRIITSGPGLSPVNGQLPEGTDPKIVALEYRV
ncbi:MAG: amidohydrolase family protein, partial [Pseudobdellovibrionaceae bacterium]